MSPTVPHSPLTPSPCRLVSLLLRRLVTPSPCRPVALLLCRPVAPSPCRPVALLLRRLVALSPLLLTGCELFVIGSSSGKPTIERSQRTAMGVVHLWKAELDTGNLAAATELMRHTSGRQLLAVERYELSDDLERWKKLIGSKTISSTSADTLNDSANTVHIVIDHTRQVEFSTLRRQGFWYVSRISEQR